MSGIQPSDDTLFYGEIMDGDSWDFGDWLLMLFAAGMSFWLCWGSI